MDEYQSDEQEVSKSQRKREAHALQDLGAQLTEFSETQLKALPLTDAVITAIKEYQNLPNSHGAKKRQLQYIGRVMRECDFDAVQTAINKLLSPNRYSARPKSVKPATRWSMKLTEEGDNAINELIEIQPQLERQSLRQLVRNIQKASESTRAKQQSKLEEYLGRFELD